jgi:hypothetical protein
MSLLVGLLVINLGLLGWWTFVGGGWQLAGKVATLEKRLDTLIKREGDNSEWADEVLVNKAAAEAVNSLKPELAVLTDKANPAETPAVLGASDQTKEFFVPLGSGSTTKSEWADVPALQVTVNGDRYGQTVKAYLEASLRSVNGKAEARLLDRTTSEVIHQSNIAHEGSEFNWVVSKPFDLPEGGRTYVVQMRSSSGETVEASGVRLRIVAN